MTKRQCQVVDCRKAGKTCILAYGTLAGGVRDIAVVLCGEHADPPRTKAAKAKAKVKAVRHPNAGKWRCARCDHRWKPSKKPARQTLPPCPNCREADDVFPADDGGWEAAERERAQRPSSDFDFIDDAL